MSLRTKQALILLLATVLPFALGGAAVHFVVAPAYRRAVASGSQEVARRLADHLAWNVARDVARLGRLAAWDRLRDRARASRRTEVEARELERRWPDLTGRDPDLRALLGSAVSEELAWWQRTDVGTTELIATDARGQVIAASGKPADFLQADEDWWQKAYAGGRGRLYVSDVLYDESARTWGIEIVVPLYEDGAPGTRALGVLKQELDLARTFDELRAASVGATGEVMLVDHRGRVLVSGRSDTPTTSTLAAPDLTLLRSTSVGTALARAEPDGALFAWSEVPLRTQLDMRRARVPTLFVVTRRRTEEAFGPLHAVQRWMLFIGIATISLAVIAGYWLAELLVVRQVRTLARGMHALSRGSFEGALAIADELTRSRGGPKNAQ